ncbi:MAG: hypothetical protein ABWZ99_03245, partial [Ilumatobacteraceae bacterium]
HRMISRRAAIRTAIVRSPGDLPIVRRRLDGELRGPLTLLVAPAVTGRTVLLTGERPAPRTAASCVATST